jgi:hypothetical protein
LVDVDVLVSQEDSDTEKYSSSATTTTTTTTTTITTTIYLCPWKLFMQIIIKIIEHWLSEIAIAKLKMPEIWFTR